MGNDVHVRASRADLRRQLAQLPALVTADPAILTRIGLAALGRIRRAFVVKARGGADEAGDSWPPLRARTVAYGRRGRSRAESKRAARPSQALTQKQAGQWWQVYRRALATFRGDRGHAAAVAWLVLKATGAQTLLMKYGGRRVEILRDTGLLLNSLTPGYGGVEQIFRTGPGFVILGTNRRGAGAHHRGAPSRNLPQRRLWPAVERWPATWWRDIKDQLKQGALDTATRLARGA